MTENNPPESAPPGAEPPVSAEDERPDPGPAGDPGYLTESGEAVAADGSVAPIIGGLPAVDGSAWDIGAPADERGAGLAHEHATQETQESQEAEEDTR